MKPHISMSNGRWVVSNVSPGLLGAQSTDFWQHCDQAFWQRYDRALQWCKEQNYLPTLTAGSVHRCRLAGLGGFDDFSHTLPPIHLHGPPPAIPAVYYLRSHQADADNYHDRSGVFMSEIKACYCGSRALVEDWTYGWLVICDNDTCRLGARAIPDREAFYFNDKESAINAWNNRPLEDELIGLLKDIRDDLKLRAELQENGVSVVNLSNSIWERIKAALAKVEGK